MPQEIFYPDWGKLKQIVEANENNLPNRSQPPVKLQNSGWVFSETER